MATDEIQLKLQIFLTKLSTFSEEMHVVYLLAELRKLVEHEHGDLKPEYRNIKFYCDWALHTAKSRDFRGLEETLELIYRDCKESIEAAHDIGEVKAQRVLEFLHFSELRRHLAVLFDRYKLPKTMLEDSVVWPSFIQHLLQVLTDQPAINMPTKHLTEICVIGANETGAVIRVYFAQPIIDLSGEEHQFYQLGDGLKPE